jgi:hypothetical protein
MATLKSSDFRTDSDAQILTLLIDESDELQSPLQAHFVLHDDVATIWCTTLNCEKQGAAWVRAVPRLRCGNAPQLLELTQLKDAAGTAVEIRQPVLFLEPPGEGPWTTGLVAQVEQERRLTGREAKFNMPLIDPNSRETDPYFAVVMLADNLLLTEPQGVPGVQIHPITASSLGQDEVLLLNAVLSQLGFSSPINPEIVIRAIQQRRPAVAIHIPKCRAVDADAAIELCRRTVIPLLDILALRRGAPPRVIGGAVGLLDSQNVPQGDTFWIEGSGYAGNMMGGMLSGENIHGLQVLWEGLSREPRARLWLSLYTEALADQRWDYRLFRCFQLLEGIASEVVPEGIAVLDDNGNVRLAPGGDTYTTSRAHGKVYELLRSVAIVSQAAQANFTAQRLDGAPVSLWDEVGLWIKIRNEVAHRGSWLPADGQAPSDTHTSVMAEMGTRTYGGLTGTGSAAVLDAIRQAVRSTLSAALRGCLTYIPR